MWLRDEFNLDPRFASYTKPDRYRTIGSGLEYDPFADSWITRDKNRAKVLSKYRKARGDIILECKIPDNASNRFLMIPPRYIQQQSVEYDGDYRIEKYRVPAPKGDLYFTVKFQKDVSTQWIVEEPVKEIEDLKKIMSIPYKTPEMDFSAYNMEKARLGESGITIIQVDTPLVTVSGMMRFEDYLMLTAEDEGLLRELCDIAYERLDTLLDRCLEADMGPVFRFNGSEQSTPPMNSPKIYEDFIYYYEKKLAEKVHKAGCFAAVHCHGYVKEVLPLMVDAGIDLLDPVEAPPSGNITFEEAMQTAGGNITLAGNIQFRDLENGEPRAISQQTEELLNIGKNGRFILDTTASPITYLPDKTRDNYLAMIDSWEKNR
jgi:uroporphyrinogen-III decarboxylase